MSTTITIDQCIAVVAHASGIPSENILSSDRTSTVARARSVAIYLAREHSDFLGRQLSWAVLASAFNRDPTSVRVAHKSVRAEIRHNARLREFVHACGQNLVGGTA